MTPEQGTEVAGLLLDKAPSKSSTAQQLVALAMRDNRVLRGRDGATYAVLTDGGPFAQALRGEDSFRRQLANRFYAETGKVANSSALADSLLVLEGQADQTDPVEVYQRLAPIEGGVLLDLGRADQALVEVTSQGWTVRAGSSGDPLFKRACTMGPMPEPVRGGALRPLWRLLNVAEADRPLLQGWMVATFLAEAQPFLLLRGEQGTGKTTVAKMLLTLLDPGPGQMAAPPRNERDWGVTANGRIALGLDNLSSIAPWMSDAFCRAVTGESMVGRALYTNDALSILRFRIALIITSIEPGALRGDLAERMLSIGLEPLGDRRCGEQQILDEFEILLPALLGAVLDLVVVVLRNRPLVDPPRGGWPRMADFGTVLAALDREFDSDTLTAYMSQVLESEVDAVIGDPLADAVTRLLRTAEDSIEVTATTLHRMLLNQEKEPPTEMRRGWRTPREMSTTLKHLAKGLRLNGVLVEHRKSGNNRLISMSFSRVQDK